MAEKIKKQKKKDRQFSQSMTSLAKKTQSLDDFLGGPSLDDSFSEMMLDGTVSRLNRYGLSKEDIEKIEPDPENPYKTRYITIQPDDASYCSASVFSHRDLPELNEDDADWLFQPDSSQTGFGLGDSMKDLKMTTRLEERLRKKGLIEDGSDSEGSIEIVPGSPKKSPKKLRVALRKSPTRTVSKESVVSLASRAPSGDESLASINMDDVMSPKTKKPQKKRMRMKKSDMLKARKEFFSLINLSPKVKKDRKKYDDKTTHELLEKNPWLAKEKLEVDFFKDDKGKSLVYPLSLLCALGGSKETIVRCLLAYKSAVSEVDDGMGTPLHYACAFHSQEGMVKFLYKQEPSAVTSFDRERRTPLHVAAWSETEPEIVSFLAKKCPEALKMEDEHGNRPIHLACREGADFEIIKALAPKKHPDICLTQAHSGATPLHLALFHELPYSVIEYLVETNPKALKIVDSKGKLPLHVAVSVETTKKVVQYILFQCKGARDATTKNGKTAYSIAKKHGFAKEVLKLLSSDHS